MRRLFIAAAGLVAVAATAPAQVTFPSLNSSPWLGQEMLGRVTNNSVNVNVIFDRDMLVYYEYGTASGTYASKTAQVTCSANSACDTVLSSLTPNTRYYYRLQYAPVGSTTFTARPERSFVTQRPKGTPFTFLIQADPHMDNNSSPDQYKLTLANELAEKADFLIDLGDVMLTDKLNAAGVPGGGGSKPTTSGVLARTQMHRSYYDLATHSLPLFLALGNHEGEWSSNLTGTSDSFAIWDVIDRNAYMPNPAPDGFYTGDTQLYDLNGKLCVPGGNITCGLGQRRSYYAWEWGDALFVVLDPFWNQTAGAQAGSGQDCCPKNDWSLTLGTVQYNWLKQTLEKSAATYKFVFSHNMVGGVNPVANGVAQGPMRGGVEVAKFLEWGGYNYDGTWGFSTYRPNMAMPIHQLLLANHVNAYFHGHDHLYMHQSLDGIAYQEVPQPSATNGSLGNRAADYGYVQGTALGGRGFLRVQVAPSGVTVQYVETWLPSEEKGGLTNRMVADSYTIPAPATLSTLPLIVSVANAAGGSSNIAPNMWMEIKGTNFASAAGTRTWKGSDFVSNRMPTQLDGISVTVGGKAAYVYYVGPTQINVLTPPDALTGTVTVRVTVNGAVSNAFSAPAQPLSPSLFTFSGNSYVAATHSSGALVGPATLYPGASTPAKPGETVVLYANGFGPTSTPVVAGSMQQSGTLTPQPVIQIGGSAATVSFAGLVSPGLYQFNVVVPDSTPDGDQAVLVTHNGQSTQAVALLTVQH